LLSITPSAQMAAEVSSQEDSMASITGILLSKKSKFKSQKKRTI